jgi:hypothetical protein
MDIFDALNKASDRSHAYHKIRELEHDIRRMKNECGSCDFWMKTSLCPREEKGHKVTCGEWICDKFIMHKWTEDLIKSKNDRISELKIKNKIEL